MAISQEEKYYSQKPIAVTALMPVKNGFDFIYSARQQISNTCREFDEILVIDDSSTDGTFRALQSWAVEDQRVRVLSNSGDGLVSALNLGIKESSNNWIARFDVDDKYAGNRIDQQISSVSHKTVAVFSDYEIWSPNSSSLGKIPSPVNSEAVKISLVNSRRTPHPSVLYSKEAVLAVGGYRVEDFPAEDLSLWLRMSRAGEIISVPEVLLKYQLRLTSVSNQQRSLIVNRTSDLIHQFGIHREALDRGFEQVDAILDSYHELTLAKERQILFLLELSKAMQLAGERKRGVILSTLIKRFDMEMCKAVVDISSGTARRRIYRKLG